MSRSKSTRRVTRTRKNRGGRRAGRGRTGPSASSGAFGVLRFGAGAVCRLLRHSGRLSRGLLRAMRRLVPGRAKRRRLRRAFARLPWPVQGCAAAAIAVGLWWPANWVYQTVRKPSELLFPVSDALYKSPSETWSAYAPLFRLHATDVMTPELLAALAQVEGSGNPVVRTYWRWRLTFRPFEIYRPASSAVGMYQITDGTFAEARRYCIHDHVVAEQGAWTDFDSCWFNALYTRTIPSHSIEMTSAYLDRRVAETLERVSIGDATLEQKQRLAAVIHLCGRGAGVQLARRGLEVAPGQRCGSHDLAAYLRQVRTMTALFARGDDRIDKKGL